MSPMRWSEPLEDETRGAVPSIIALQLVYMSSQVMLQPSTTRGFGKLKDSCPSADYLRVGFTSASHVPWKTPVELARKVNTFLHKHLLETPRNTFLGILVMDFPTEALCDLIIQRNATSLHPCRRVKQTSMCEAYIYDYVCDLQCELQAAASTADAVMSDLSVDPLERKGRLHRLSSIFIKLALQRAQLELELPSVDEPESSHSSAPLGAAPVNPIEASIPEAPIQEDPLGSYDAGGVVETWAAKRFGNA
eukprot:5439544-Amphidinium_carterae.1